MKGMPEGPRISLLQKVTWFGDRDPFTWVVLWFIPREPSSTALPAVVLPPALGLQYGFVIP